MKHSLHPFHKSSEKLRICRTRPSDNQTSNFTFSNIFFCFVAKCMVSILGGNTIATLEAFPAKTYRISELDAIKSHQCAVAGGQAWCMWYRPKDGDTNPASIVSGPKSDLKETKHNKYFCHFCLGHKHLIMIAISVLLSNVCLIYDSLLIISN